jgi:hypothetical protein
MLRYLFAFLKLLTLLAADRAGLSIFAIGGVELFGLAL